MSFILTKPKPSDSVDFAEFFAEFVADGGRINPGIMKKYNGDFSEFLDYLKAAASRETVPDGRVECDIYFMKNSEDSSKSGRIYGMCALRPRLTDSANDSGGHIAYGIRPSERGRGFGKTQLALILEKYRSGDVSVTDDGYKGSVMITCEHDNTSSIKVVLANGGVFLDEIPDEDDGCMIYRYLIKLKQET